MENHNPRAMQEIVLHRHGTQEDSLALTPCWAKAVWLYGNVPKSRRLPGPGAWYRGTRECCRTAKDLHCSDNLPCGADGQTQGIPARAKPLNAARAHLDQEEFRSVQGSVPCPVLPEQAGTTQIAYLIHSLDKPSRMIKILQYVTLKSKVSWTH